MELRLTALDFPFWVEVRLWALESGWLAMALIGGDTELGVGATANAALAAAMSSLGPSAVEAFCGDPQLEGMHAESGITSVRWS